MHVRDGDSLRLRCTLPLGVSFMPPQNHRATTLRGSRGPVPAPGAQDDSRSDQLGHIATRSHS